MPPGPSRSQEYLAAMEARKATMTESQETWQRSSMQPPPRRFNSGDGRRATYNAQPSPGEGGDRGTIYFDASDTPGPASPQAASMHARTGSTASARGSPLKSSMRSPARATFNPPTGPPPPVPRSSSNLNPSSGLLPPRRPTDPQHTRAGSYAGSSSAPRLGAHQMTPTRSAGWAPREEADLSEQRMDMSFEERAGMQSDAFGDGAQAPPRRPFAPTSAPGYRYSSVQ
ncbi:hypothetical protein FRB90_006786 [Tulasnella sp. 427]|nr:hypothetical protein FRB90_006786 [Tulasnella sp. 427]